MLIERARSLIPALDMHGMELLIKVVTATADIEAVGAYKVGFAPALTHGLGTVVREIRKYTSKPIIYDHQKAGGDIPDMGAAFAEVASEARVNAVIIFPHAGPKTEVAWIKAVQEKGLGVIVGELMTHEQFLDTEGGWISGERIRQAYSVAAGMGVRDFVVPGTKPQKIAEIRSWLESNGAAYTYYSPGLVTQKGDITEAGSAAGRSWHAIIGRGIFAAENPRKATLGHASRL